jgi:hypothetical protein
MKRILAMAGAGSLAWMVLWGGSVSAAPDSHPRLVQDVGPYEFPRNLELPLYLEEFENAGQREGVNGDDAGRSPGAISRKIALGGDWPDPGRPQLAPASLPLARSMDSSSRLIEPQWSLGKLSLKALGDVDSGEAILPVSPVIPEPAALLLLGSGFLVLAAFGKKWKGKVKSDQ